jgi:hypothetical protein
MTAPSPYQGCTILAPCLHQPCTKSSRYSRGLCSEHAGFTYHQPAESGIALPALERTKSEGRANKERRKSEQGAEKCLRNLSRVIPNPDVNNYPKIQVCAIKQKVYAIKIHIPLQLRNCFRFILLPFSIYYSSCKFRIYLLFYLNTCFIGRPIHT